MLTTGNIGGCRTRSGYLMSQGRSLPGGPWVRTTVTTIIVTC